MVIDTVRDLSGVGSLHGRTGGMKIPRPVHSSHQRPEAKAPLLSAGMEAAPKGANTDPDNKPCFVIRRRIMVRQSEEADDAAGGRIHGLAPALPNDPLPVQTAVENLSPAKSDLSPKHCDDMAFARCSSTTTQDQVADCRDVRKTKPRKMLRLFDLNKVPSMQENLCSSPTASSPTSTIVSADSTSHFAADHASTWAMATRSNFLMVDTDAFFSAFPSSSSLKRSRCDEGEDQARRGLAVDLGFLAPASETTTTTTTTATTATTTRRHSSGVECRHHEDQQFAFRKPQQVCTAEVGATGEGGTRARKRLRKLSEYAGGHSSTTSMAKSWTTGDGDGCNNRDVTKTSGRAVSQADVKVRRCGPDDDVVDDEVWGAVAALHMLSSATSPLRRRDVPRFSSRGEASSPRNGRSTFADSHMDERAQRREATPAASTGLAASEDDAPSRSVGSGCSVLLRPRNKQRYRTMAEIMAHTPILRRRA